MGRSYIFFSSSLGMYNSWQIYGIFQYIMFMDILNFKFQINNTETSTKSIKWQHYHKLKWMTVSLNFQTYFNSV